MKKIYSIVLVATALLIGTNAWAGNVTGNDRAALQAAIDAAASGTTLTLQNDFTLDGPVWLGTADLNGAYKSIELDLNGHKISMTSGGANSYMFVLSHGELLVRNSSATQALIELTGSTGDNNNTQIFTVFGSYKSSRWNETGSALQTDSSKIINTRVQGWFSHLEIGQNVKIVAGSGVLGSGIAVDGVFATEGAFAKITALGHTINYKTDIFTGQYSLAQGVRVDVYGEIEMAGAGVAGDKTKKAYGIKVNGNVWLPSTAKDLNSSFADATYKNNFNTATRQLDTIDVPFVYVHSSAKLVVDNKSIRATAVYSSGYSKMLIEGHCEGAVGVYANSGKVEIHDAEIVSTSQTYNTPTSDGGAQGNGSAIVVNSRDNYTGSVSVTISGDSKVTASSGYAIEEIVNTTSTTTKVDNVAIEGGTIEGGDKGAIIVSDATATDKNAHVTFYGGTVDGNTQVGTAGTITDILPKDNNNQPTAHVTIVTDPDTGKQTIVVSEGANAPSAQTEWDDIMKLGDGTDVNWTGTDAGVLGDGTTATVKKLGEVQMTAGTSTTPQQLTIRSKATLEVKHLIMNKYAQITVEAGAKLIVKGEQGIVAPVADNIVLKASETEGQATFLFNPAVTSNRHPMAKVQYQSNSFYSDHNVQQFFGLPTYNGTVTNIETTSDAKIYFDLWRNPGWDYIGAINVPGDPNVMANLNKFNLPFGLVCITSKNDAAHKPVFTFSGELTGNMDHTFTMYNGWTSMSNAYTGPIGANAILNQLAAWNASYGTEQSVYTYDLNPATGAIQWHARSKYSAPLPSTGLNAMEPIMFHNNSKVEGIVLDYSTLVWDPYVQANPISAPARQTISNITKAQINIAGENEADYTTIVADSELGDDRSFCAPKYDNAGLQLYVMGNEKFDIYAADEIENSYIGFRAVNAGMYTISFENVQGEDLILVDLVNGARTNIEEGAVYTFHAEANETNDYRFQIIVPAKLPTGIDQAEADASAKKAGVYTLTGLYLGNASIFNALPAGVYVVDGVKKVK